jgi:adenine-specific DNA-methyltransferase
MNTDPKTNNPFRAPSHPEQSSTDTNPQPIHENGNPLDIMVNQITHGDCLQVLRRLPDDCADLVLTDPPYLVRYQDTSGRRIANDDNSRWMYPAFSELYRVLKPNRFCISFYGWSKADRFLSAWRECGFRPVGHFVWVKRYASSVRLVQMKHEQAYLLAKGNPSLPACPPADVLPWKYTGNRLHPTQKPVESLTPLIGAFSQPRDIIVDPFGGSGTTAIAARQMGRRFILIEKDAGYFRAATERLRNFQA